MKIVVTGSTGFIGRPLGDWLAGQGHTVVPVTRQVLAGESLEEALTGAGAVINLAGEPVAQRWTGDAKRRIRESRVETTRRLVVAMSTVSDRPGVLVSASAIGIYGSRGDEVLTEQSAPAFGFLAEVCREWEEQADMAEALGLRVVKLRIGVVLGRGGGALKQMLPPFKAGVGGRLGSGRQWMSWIHRDDLVRLIGFALETPLRGVVNATSPGPVTNAEFTTALAKAIHRPAVIPVPAFALRLLYGEMSEILLSSQRVLPRAAGGAGFQFRYPEIVPAIASVV